MKYTVYAKRFKKFFQVSTYLPHFISTVVMCGIEEEWDAYIAKLNQMSVEQLIQIHLDAYARYMGE